MSVQKRVRVLDNGDRGVIGERVERIAKEGGGDVWPI